MMFYMIVERLLTQSLLVVALQEEAVVDLVQAVVLLVVDEVAEDVVVNQTCILKYMFLYELIFVFSCYNISKIVIYGSDFYEVQIL